MLNSFVLVSVFTAIYAILAANLFGPAKPELFGNFGYSLFTMFQVTKSCFLAFELMCILGKGCLKQAHISKSTIGSR